LQKIVEKQQRGRKRKKLLNFQQSCEKLRSANSAGSARLAAGEARPAVRSTADSPQANAKRAFCTGIVKNQQGSDSELL
jgi:hypothetical protein